MARADLIARSLAIFLALFSIGNIAGEIFAPGFDANLFWIDLRFFPPAASRTILAVVAAIFLWFGLRPPVAPWRQWLTIVTASLLAIVALANAAQFYLLLAKGSIVPRLPIALSLGVALSLGCIAWTARGVEKATVDLRDLLRIAVMLLMWIGLFPLLQTLCFGKTDYRRSADVAVVFGARAYANGQPSDALADRVRTACQLYNSGVVKKLIFSGGPGDGPIHETEAMRRMALSLGVNDQDILLDNEGLNTQRTIAHTALMFSQMHASRVLAVSHFYHLPRIKMAYQRHGWNVYTVPATETYFLSQIPYSMAREVFAFWAYYCQPLR